MKNFESITIDFAVDGEIISKTCAVNAKTEYDEPRIIIPLSDGTRFVMTQERYGLKHDYDWYVTGKHLSENDEVLASFKYCNDEQMQNSLTIFFKKLYLKGITIENN